MNNVLKLGKKIFTFSVVATTIMWSLGVATLVPSVAQAADVCPAGLAANDVVKVGKNPKLYVLGADLKLINSIDNQVVTKAGKKYYFSAFKSWNIDDNYGTIKNISAECFSALGMAGKAFGYRPGSQLLKHPVTGNLIVVLPGRSWANISEAAATALYGYSASMVLPTFTDNDFIYSLDGGQKADITASVAHDGMFVKQDSKVYYVTGGKLVEVTEAGVAANRVRTSIIRSVATTGLTVDTAKYDSNVVSVSDRTGTGITPGTTGPVVTGNMTVSLAANTPATAGVPYKATHVPFLTFNINSLNAATISSITFKRIGLGDNDNFLKVWLEKDGTPVSNAQTVGSDDTVILSPNMLVSAGNTTLTLVANLATAGASTAMEDGFQVTAVDAGTGVTVAGLPVSGNKMNYRAVEVNSVTLTDKGSDASVKVGDTGAILGEFSMQYTSGNDTKGSFEFIRLRNTGDANLTDLSNLVLTENGVAVSAPAAVSGDYVTFVLNNDAKLIGDSKTRNFELTATINGGENAKTYNFVLKDVRDIYVKDAYNGYGASVTKNNLNCNTETDELCVYTLDAGQFTVSNDDSNPNNSKYIKNTKNITAMVAKMKLGQGVNVEGLKVYLASGTTAASVSEVNADIERVQLYVGDRRIGTVSAVTDGGGAITTHYYDFDTSFSLKNADLVKIVVDLKSNAANHTYKFTFSSSNFVTPEYTNGDTVPTASRSGVVTSNNLEITSSTVTVVENDGYTTDQTFLIGSTNQKLMQVLVSAGSSADVYIKTLKFSMSSTSAYSYFTNMYVMFDGVKFDLTKDMTSGGTVSFTGINKLLAKNAQTTVALYADVQTGLENNATSTFTLANTDNGTVMEDSEGTATAFTAVTTPRLKFVSSGTLSVSTDSATPLSSLAIAGQTVDLATWRLSDQNGAVDVTDVYVANTDGSVSSLSTSAADFMVSKYQLVWKGNVIAEAAPVSGKVHFDLASDKYIAVANGGTEKITVRAVLNNISNVANTGKQFKLALYAMEAQNKSGTTLSSITGVATSDSYVSTTAKFGNSIMTVKTAPTLATVNTLGTLSNGATEIYRFTVTAPVNGDVTWNKVVLSVGGSCTGGTVAVCLGDTTAMRIKSGGTNIPATFSTSSGKLTIDLTGVESVSANSSVTYYVEADLAHWTIADDTLTVSIKDAGAGFNTPGAYDVTATTFRWADNSGVYESTTDEQWYNGYKVSGLDTATYKLQK